MLTTLPLALQFRQHARPLRLCGGRRTPLHSRYASVYSFNVGDSDFQNQIDTLIHMSDRALNVLELITPEIQGVVEKHVSGALFNVIAEVEDIKAFAYEMQMQGEKDGK
jgi:hypothetical protein